MKIPKINICLTFDDGRIDNYFIVLPILEKYKIPATFFITTGYIDKTWKNYENWGSSRGPMSIQQVIELEKKGMEVASHTDTHFYSYHDVTTSIEKLKSWGIKNVAGFSVPNSNITKEKLIDDEILKKTNLKYVRVGRNPKCFSFFNKIIYVLHRIFKFNFLFYLFNRHNIIKEHDQEILYSIVIKRNDNYKNIIYFVNKLIKKKQNCTIVFMLHSVLNENDPFLKKDKWVINEKTFLKIVEHLYSGNNQIVKIKTISSLYHEEK